MSITSSYRSGATSLLRQLTTTTARFCSSSSSSPAPPPPSSLRQATSITYHRGSRVLEVDLDNGERHRFSAELLRIASASAEMTKWRAMGGPGDDKANNARRVVAGRRGIGIIRIDPIGSYAVRLTFDDLHDTGIYSWDYLALLSSRRRAVAREYLQALRARGLSRRRSERAGAGATTAAAAKSGQHVRE